MPSSSNLRDMRAQSVEREAEVRHAERSQGPVAAVTEQHPMGRADGARVKTYSARFGNVGQLHQRWTAVNDLNLFPDEVSSRLMMASICGQ